MTANQLSPDDRVRVEERADAFLSDFVAWAGDQYRATSLNEMRAALTDVLTGMSSVAAPERVHDLEAAFQQIFAAEERFSRAMPPGSVWTVRDVDLAPLWVALDEALADFDDERLAAARSERAAAAERLQQLRTRLSRAVDAADVAAVRSLRDQVELDAPSELAEAEAKVRALEVQRAQAVSDRARQRYEPVAASQQQALRRVEELGAALADAERALRAAQERMTLPQQVANVAAQRLVAAEHAVKEQAAAATEARRAQVLRLAGIPTGITPQAPSQAEINRRFEAEAREQLRADDQVGRPTGQAYDLVAH